MLTNVQRLTLSKPAITRLFIAAVAFLGVGWLIGIVVVISAVANGAIALGGPQLVTVNPGPLTGAVAGLGVAALITGIGTVGLFVCWLAALRNTWGLEDKAWFLGILGLGVARFGWVALVAYILRGPDAAKAASRVA